MVYEIQPRTFEVAKTLGVSVYPSDNPKYKIEIYDTDGEFMFYGGAMGYGDFPTYQTMAGSAFARKRRRLYKIRHRKEIEKKGSRGWYIYRLLWS